MPRTIKVTVYKFSELSEAAQSRACDNERMGGDCWGWSSEWWQSAQAFSKIAPITIDAADYDRRHVSIEWTGPDYASRYDHSDAIAGLSGLRAWKWLENNGWFAWATKEADGACSMTGFCGDAPFGDAIKGYRRNPLSVPDLKQVFYEAAQDWCSEAASDCEHAHSDEAIGEMLEINEYEFDTDGNMV